MKSETLSEKKCQPCEGKTKPFTKEEAQNYLREVNEWELDSEARTIFRNFNMKNFKAAIKFINQIGEIAESENHHPDIHLTGYRKLRIDLSTHAIGGLSENDFIVAAKINQVPIELKV